MPYGFNNDKSKEEVYSKEEMDTWTQLPITNTTYFSGVVNYKKIGNEVTIKLNINFIKGATGDGNDIVIINSLPNEIRPIDGGAGMGTIVQSPAYFTNQKNLVSFRIGIGLRIYPNETISASERDYINTEIKYNVKTTP